MVYFIPGKGVNDELESLRERIMVNTASLLELFRERIRLARKISSVKYQHGGELRDRDQELNVMRSLNNVSYVERRILNMIFEFTISVERSVYTNPEPINLPLRINGDVSSLLCVVGLMISSPGVEIYSIKDLPACMENSILSRGGHIVKGTPDLADLRVCIRKKCDICDVKISGDGTLEILSHVLFLGNYKVVEVLSR